MPAVQSRPPSLTADEYVAVVQDALALWESRPQMTMEPGTGGEPLVLVALELEVVQSARAVLALIDVGLQDATAILVRKALEFAVVAQWIYHHENGLKSFLAVSDRSDQRLIAQMGLSKIAVPDGVVEMYEERLREVPAERKIAEQFVKVCQSFGDAAAGLYLQFRALSGRSHPSMVALAPHNVPADGTDGSSQTLRLVTGAPMSAAWLFTLATSLVLAGSAADAVTQGDPRADELAALATRIGIPVMLTPVDAGEGPGSDTGLA